MNQSPELYLPYTGIGARQTPHNVQNIMKNLAFSLRTEYGFILRSGGARGADLAFENGAGQAKEIFKAHHATPDATTLAARFHPAWNNLDDYGKKLMARNVMQVLGENLDSPSAFVVCWTPNGAMTGGTSQALRIAKEWNIPIFNLFDSNALKNCVVRAASCLLIENQRLTKGL